MDGLTEHGWPLNPCPHCSKESFDLIFNDQDKEYRVSCKNCGANGPPGTTPGQAKWKWDVRLKP